jgi:hypothetical protein
MRDVVRPAPPAVDLGDLVASYVRIWSDLVENDPHNRLRAVSIALKREVDFQRRFLIHEENEEPDEAPIEEVLA